MMATAAIEPFFSRSVLNVSVALNFASGNPGTLIPGGVE